MRIIAIALVSALLTGCASEFDQVGIYTEWDAAPPRHDVATDAGDVTWDAADAGQPDAGDSQPEASVADATGDNSDGFPPFPADSVDGSQEASPAGDAADNSQACSLDYCSLYCGPHFVGVCDRNGHCSCGH